MELEQRVAELERRLTALERQDRESPRLGDGDFWALSGLKQQLADAGEAAADGGVLFTGAVRLPTGEQYEWQYGALTGALLEEEGTGDEERPDHAPATADSLAALGHPVRLRLLREILGGRRTAAELAALDAVGTTGQIYHHLRQLTGAGWLHTAGRGRYEVPAARVVPLLVLLAAARP
ncbi:helix-turn-helix domain-containing protein [Streptomyces microflavus]|uniref:Helix-turn-helix transcriptional regulator n=1 Tax=Streptomyces microflavus TaxID=1919 RepID=A0A6N9VPU1_STRMI|nr:helix-turn-helix domain-containing protein [Streptomyces microflavus]NEB73258.1 helix-turn-helix transcriptional regulator [Streptomyces microflavus]NEE58269.1 helix-turn-helix transcriptional regulator [Streptomyces sp. SID8455]WSR92725.1 helix-turn-helix domain-containing protein [Streptomyces microflavus]